MENTYTNITWRLLLPFFFSFAIQSPLTAQTPGSSNHNAWINEIHYDNVGTDASEAIEIVVEKETFTEFDLSQLAIHLYKGENGQVYASYNFPDEATGIDYDPFTIFTMETARIENGPDGIALSYGGQLLQFLSYEGVITAVDGIAAGITSTDIVVTESGETPLDYSLQLIGTGDEAFQAARHRLSESNQSVIKRAQRLSDLGARSKRALSDELKASGPDVVLPEAIEGVDDNSDP